LTAIKRLAIVAIMGVLQELAYAQSTQPGVDAATLYTRAGTMLSADYAKNIESPSSSNLTYPGYPPMPVEWLRMEKQDYEAHAQVRALVHEATLLDSASWPQFDPNNHGRRQLEYLGQCRSVANEIGDAALYQSEVLNDQPAAFQSAEDLMHMAVLLKNQPGEVLVRLLVAEGIEAMDAYRLLVMISGAAITEDASDKHDLPLATANQWIARLLDHPDAQAEFDQAMKGEPLRAQSLPRLLETIHREQAERDMTAMSLAAHVYQHKWGSWPESLEELKTELPRVPVDPWGDGKQTLGYVLIKGGLPNGLDRPLVYSRCNSKDGLFFRTDEPEYGYYNNDGSNLPARKQKQGGQFRDVARWAPADDSRPETTTQPLE